MSYSTTAGLPTEGEEFAQLIEHLRKAQEHAAMLGHLRNSNDDATSGQGWLAISEMLKMTQINVTKLATGKMVKSIGYRRH